VFLHQLRTEFKRTVPVSEGFFKLMKSNFRFYTDLCEQFYSSLGPRLDKNLLQGYLKDEIRPKLFDEQVCRGIEAVKKSCLAETIKLEQSPAFSGVKSAQVVDLKELKSIGDAIYELLQTHWELYRYQQSVVNDRVLISFLEEVQRIEVCWDLFVAKYLAASELLSQGDTLNQPKDGASVKVYYHLPSGQGLDLETTQKLSTFFQLAYQFTTEVHGIAPDSVKALQVLAFEAAAPSFFTLVVPKKLANSFSNLLDYLSIDVIKRETLVKYVMEVLQQQQKQELPKPLINSYLKKIAKALNELPAESYFSIDPVESRDSVHILTDLVAEMDRMKLSYKDLMLGPERRLGRNANSAPAAVEAPQAENPTAPKADSTVNINVSKKEHHGFLTS